MSLSNFQLLDAVLYVREHSCKWYRLPKRFINSQMIYTRMHRWSKSGELDRVFKRLLLEQIIRIEDRGSLKLEF